MNKNKFSVIFAIFILMTVISTFAETKKDFPKLTGPYLGQKPPGMTPEIFTPSIISTDISEGCSGWGSRMEYFVFQRWINRKPELYIMNQVDGLWNKPVLLPFGKEYQVGDFTVAPDGKTLIFASEKFIDEIGVVGEGCNIWMIKKTDTGWSEPRHLGLEVNTQYHDSYPCLTANGNLYFFSRRPGGYGDSDLYMSEFKNGKYQSPINLGPELNTAYHEWDTYVAPDEGYMIYCSTMPGGLGSDDLYVTFKQKDGSWSKPVHMGKEINSEKSENRPYVSPDGKYFFYTSTKTGNRDIYWVDAKILEYFKDIHSRDRMNRTPLHNAAARGMNDLLIKQIKQGADPNTKDIYGSTPLHEAVLYGHKDTVTLLLSSGADIDICRPDGTTPLHIARERGNRDITDLLLKKGARDKPKVFPELKGDYLGQKKPGKQGVIFAPGIISKAESRDLMHGFFDNEKCLVFFRYPVDFKGNWTQYPVFLMKKVGERWIEPYQSTLKGKPWFYNFESVPEGERMIFAWTRNLDGSGPPRELYLWSSTKTPDGWTKPTRFEPPINRGFDTWPSLSADKTLYFHSRRAGCVGRADIYMSRPEKGEYKKVKNLGKMINTKYTEHDPHVAPDGSYLLYSSFKPGGYGEDDIYITYRKSNGTWTKPINLGDKINSKYSENRAFISPDGKYLFYTSSRTGNPDAYWVDAKIIETLRPKEMK